MLILLAVIAAVAWGASDYFGGASRRGASVFAVVAISQLLGLVLLIPVLLVHGRPLPSDPHLWYACVAGLGVTLELRLVYYAISRGDAFITAPVGALGAAIAVLVGLIGGDHLDLAIAAGLLCAVIGGGVCAWSGGESGGTGRRQRWATAAICAGAAIGVATMLVSFHAAGRVDPYWATSLVDASTALPATVAALAFERSPLRSRLPHPRHLPSLALVAGAGISGDLAYAAASRQAALSIVSAISSLYPVATILLGVTLQRRRAAGLQAVGIALALAGAVLLGAATR